MSVLERSDSWLSLVRESVLGSELILSKLIQERGRSVNESENR